MAMLWITEFAALDVSGGCFAHPPVAEQTVEIEGKSAQSKPFGSNTAYVRLYANGRCSFAIGADPKATTKSAPLLPGMVESAHVAVGHRIAVIANNQ